MYGTGRAHGRRCTRGVLHLAALALVLFGAVAWSPAARANPCGTRPTVMFAGLNWESGEFITAVWREILQRGYGCRTDTIPGNTLTFEQALGNDDIQFVAEEWINRSEIWNKAAAAGKVRAIGRTFTGATEGWAVPEYLVKGDPEHHLAAAAPDLRSVAQLSDPRYVALFRDPEQPDRGRFLNCPSGWTCEPENTAKLKAYGLDKLYVDFRPGTGPAMDAEITSAFIQRQPLLFYFWSPSAIAGRFALVQLAEPPHDTECWQRMRAGIGPGCASPPSIISYGLSAAYAAAAPEIVSALERAVFPLAQLNANLAEMARTQRGAPAQAVVFLRARPEIWRPWVGDAIADRIAATLHDQVPGEPAARTASNFPNRLVLSIRQPVNQAVVNLVSKHGSAFRAASHAILSFIVLLDTAIAWIPWWLLIGLFMLLAWLGTRRPILTAVVGLLMLAVGVLGLWDLMLQTLTLMLISSVIALLFGLPLGVLTAKSAWFRTLVLATLDIMQTMPSFVYLIPALMLFGLGKVPAIIATVIYAIPPMIRLTALGIEQVPAEIKEAATAFGVTPMQMLLQVELPLAEPSIMAGINQTIMLALSMVVVASMIGARGLGEQVLNGIQNLDVGQGLEAGIGIVILAVVLDRITQGFGAESRDTRSSRG